MINFARMFSYCRLLEAVLDRERAEHLATRNTLERERQRFVDAMRRDSGKSPIYVIPDLPRKLPPPPAIGSTGARVRDAEMERRKEEAQTGKVSPIPIPAAVGVTGALARDREVERRRQNDIASDEAIRMSGLNVVQANGAIK